MPGYFLFTYKSNKVRIPSTVKVFLSKRDRTDQKFKAQEKVTFRPRLDFNCQKYLHQSFICNLQILNLLQFLIQACILRFCHMLIDFLLNTLGYFWLFSWSSETLDSVWTNPRFKWPSGRSLRLPLSCPTTSEQSGRSSRLVWLGQAIWWIGRSFIDWLYPKVVQKGLKSVETLRMYKSNLYSNRGHWVYHGPKIQATKTIQIIFW